MSTHLTAIAHVCAAIGEDLDGVTRRIVARIRTALPVYAAVDYDDQYHYIRDEIVIILDCLAGGDDLPEQLVTESREVGMRRAHQGLSLPDVVATYHLALKEIWSALVEKGADQGPAVIEAAGALWDHVHVLTSAVADGHSEASRSVQAVRAGQRFRLLDGLTRWPTADVEDLSAVALQLDLVPAGDFTAVVTPATGWSEADGEAFQSALDRSQGAAGRQRVQCSRVGDQVVALTQGPSTSTVVQTLRAHLDSAPVGVGMCRAGLPGAAASIDDATLASRVAPSGRVSSFEDVWTDALLLEHRQQADGLLAAGRTVAADHPHLADGVRAFAGCGFSISAGARALHLHPNSVAYRLQRWRELTGWDPHTFDGLARSVACLGHSPRPDG